MFHIQIFVICEDCPGGHDILHVLSRTKAAALEKIANDNKDRKYTVQKIKAQHACIFTDMMLRSKIRTYEELKDEKKKLKEKLKRRTTL